MRSFQEEFEVRTRGRGTIEITARIAEIVGRSGVRCGTASVFVRHTSASLLLFENADPSARVDLEAYLERVVPDGAPYFEHTLEGPDDMASHLRMALTRTCEVLPVRDARLALGTWQGLFLCEHRRAPHARSVIVTVIGE